MSPYDASKRIIQAFEEALAELRRRGNVRPTQAEAGELLETSTSTYNDAINHVRACDIYGISKMLPKMEAIRRAKRMDPTFGRIAKNADEATESRSDPEIAADAVSALVIKQAAELVRFDASALAAYLARDPQKRGATLSALIDLRRWLTTLEQGLGNSSQR